MSRLAALVIGALIGQGPASAQAPSARHHLVQADDIAWGPMGPGGLATAVVDGDPSATGPFVMMLKLRDGGWIPPHFHNVDKRLLVVKGILLMGHGDVVDEAATTAVPAGGVAVVRAGEHHYEGGRGETVVALVASGPFTTTMVRQ